MVKSNSLWLVLKSLKQLFCCFWPDVMTQSLNRMQFLRGNFKAEVAIRPPWAVSDDLFTERCTRCDDCIAACHAGILKRGGGGFPEVDFSTAGCDFCQACVTSCAEQALLLTDPTGQAPWQYKARFNNNCLSEQGITCQSCGDVCEMRAIRFKMVVGGRALIEMNSSVCNGCGECVSVCPVKAIQVKYSDQAETLHE